MNRITIVIRQVRKYLKEDCRKDAQQKNIPTECAYRSCQEAHQTERLFGRLGFDAEVAKMWERMHRNK